MGSQLCPALFVMTICTGEYWQHFSALWIRIYWPCNVDKHQKYRAGAYKRNWLKFTCSKCQTIHQGDKSRASVVSSGLPNLKQQRILATSFTREWPGATSAMLPGKEGNASQRALGEAFPMEKCWCQGPGCSLPSLPGGSCWQLCTPWWIQGE